jgi:hypothetical protein
MTDPNQTASYVNRPPGTGASYPVCRRTQTVMTMCLTRIHLVFRTLRALLGLTGGALAAPGLVAGCSQPVTSTGPYHRPRSLPPGRLWFLPRCWSPTPGKPQCLFMLCQAAGGPLP